MYINNLKPSSSFKGVLVTSSIRKLWTSLTCSDALLIANELIIWNCLFMLILWYHSEITRRIQSITRISKSSTFHDFYTVCWSINKINMLLPYDFMGNTSVFFMMTNLFLTTHLYRSVIERDMCTYCRKPLGTETKMILDELQICCHSTCFKVWLCFLHI